MPARTLVCANLYRDSAALMRMAADLEAVEGIVRATAVMATPANLAMLAEAGIGAQAPGAGPNDLLVVVEGEGDLDAAIEAARQRLSSAPAAAAGTIDARGTGPPRSLAEAVAGNPAANLALISCPGDYATAEAMKALRLGLDVMVFSDNVALADEVALKREAAEHGLLVMGPDCGTAIIGGVPLGFANAVRRGPVGIVAASGSGLQQIACLLDGAGIGLSHAFGTGGRDLSADVEGITTLAALAALSDDPGTQTIVVVSKPPDPAPAKSVIAACAGTGKRCVICFIGATPARRGPARRRLCHDAGGCGAHRLGRFAAPGRDVPTTRAGAGDRRSLQRRDVLPRGARDRRCGARRRAIPRRARSGR